VLERAYGRRALHRCAFFRHSMGGRLRDARESGERLVGLDDFGNCALRPKRAKSCAAPNVGQPGGLLPSWNEGPAKVEEFNAEAKRWMETAKHPRWNRLYTELVYQPMLEVLSYLRNNAFKTYIVTGGGQDFVRVYADRVYGIPPEQVVGSTLDTSTTTPFAGRFHRRLGGVALGAGIW